MYLFIKKFTKQKKEQETKNYYCLRGKGDYLFSTKLLYFYRETENKLPFYRKTENMLKWKCKCQCRLLLFAYHCVLLRERSKEIPGCVNHQGIAVALDCF